MWFVFALGSALFAALTSILAKVGIEGVNSTLATAIRTVVVLAMSWGMVFLPGPEGGMGEIGRRSWLFLILSGLATGASWLCYYRALQLGRASQVVPIDKLSVVITLVLAFVFLHEPFTAKVWWAAPSSPPAPCLWCCKRVSSLQTTRPSRFCPGPAFCACQWVVSSAGASGWRHLASISSSGISSVLMTESICSILSQSSPGSACAHAR